MDTLSLTLTRRPTRSGHAAVKTPWTGPLACASDGVRNIAPHSLESDSDDDWEHVPGKPQCEPVIPQRIVSTNDSESGLSSSGPPLRSSPPVERLYIPAKLETQATYSGASSRTPSVLAHNNHPPPDLTSLPIPRGIPVSLQVSPHTYDSPSVSYKGLMSPTCPSYGVINLSASGHSSGCTLSPLIKPPANPNHSNLPGDTGYNPGFGVPTPLRSSAIPLPSIHHALANAPGSNSPYLYSTPRASPSGSMKGSSSPYVPAWISPQSAVNSVLPGTLAATMSLTSVRSDDGAPLRHGGSGPGSYIVGSRVIAPY